MEVACKQKHFDGYARQAEVIAREFDHELLVVARGELRSEIGSDIYYGGMVDEVSAGLNPAQYVAGLARAAERAGAYLFEKTRVERIESEARNGEAGRRLATVKSWPVLRRQFSEAGPLTRFVDDRCAHDSRRGHFKSPGDRQSRAGAIGRAKRQGGTILYRGCRVAG